MNLEEIVGLAEQAISQANEIQALEDVRVEYMGKKGKITELLKSLGKMDHEQRKEMGQAINIAKAYTQLILVRNLGLQITNVLPVL
jgi:phenylalanyl-tRNA synthetase alpha chain